MHIKRILMASLLAAQAWAQQQVFPQTNNAPADCKDTTGSTTAYTCPSATLMAYVTGTLITFVPQTTNTTTGPTLNVAGLGVLNIKAAAGTAVAVGALIGGNPYLLEYDGTQLVQAGGGGSATLIDTWRAGLCMGGTCNGDTANGWWLPMAAAPLKCNLTASTAPSGSGISVDIKKNGTTSIFNSPIALASGVQTAVVTSFAAVTFNKTSDYATVALTGTTGSGVVVSCQFQ